MKINSATIQNWILPVAALVAWEIFGRAGMLPRYLSFPSAILAALWELAVSGELFVALAASLYRVSTGFVLGTVAGVIVGLGAGIVPGIRHFFDPLVSFLYSIPKIAFLPVFLLLFGLGHASKIAIIAFSGFFPVFIASRHAVLSVNKLLVWTAQNMGTPQRKIFFRVIIPAAAPQLFSGVRIGLAHAFVVLFAAELIGSKVGLGTIISSGEEWVRFDLMFAGIVCFAVLGFVSDRILLAVRARVLKGPRLCTSLVPGRALVLDPAAVAGLAGGGGKRLRRIPAAPRPRQGLDRAGDGDRQRHAGLPRQRDHIPGAHRLPARCAGRNSVRGGDGPVRAGPQPVRADLLHRLPDPQDRAVPPSSPTYSVSAPRRRSRSPSSSVSTRSWWRATSASARFRPGWSGVRRIAAPAAPSSCRG